MTIKQKLQLFHRQAGEQWQGASYSGVSADIVDKECDQQQGKPQEHHDDIDIKRQATLPKQKVRF